MPCLKYYNKLTEKWEPLGLTLQMDSSSIAEMNFVKYSPQSLTEEEKAQVRENIGASNLKLVETSGGLVLTDDPTSTL